MIVTLDSAAVGTFLVFCRVGSCLMILPGLSGARVPQRVRLLLALVLAVSLAPVVLPDPPPAIGSRGEVLSLAVSECAVGLLAGIVCRMYFAALEFAGATIASYVGLTGIEAGIEQDGGVPVISLAITQVATLIVISSDLCRYMVTGLVDSYAAVPMGVVPDAAASLRWLIDGLGAAFLVALRLSAPFVVFGLLVNLAFALLGKVVPQISTYFLSVPLLVLGGLVLIYATIDEIMLIFSRAVAAGSIGLAR